LRAGGTAAETHILRRLHEQPGTLNLFDLRPQPRDDLLRVGATLVARLQCDIQTTRVEGALVNVLSAVLGFYKLPLQALRPLFRGSLLLVGRVPLLVGASGLARSR
jgi:hypothetical protein